MMAGDRFYPSRQGRYALTADGRLHHWLAKEAANAIAMVRVRLKPRPLAAPAPRPQPTTAQAPARRTLPPKIDLNTVPSAMEQRAASWRKSHVD